MASWTARGFSPVTIENDSGVLERVLALLGRPAWEVTAEDVDRVVGDLAADGLAASTRRGYVQAFKGFHRFLQARKAAEIEALFGVRLVCPVDEFNAARHVGDDSPALLPPPTPERVDGVLRVPEGPDRDGPQVRAGRPGLRAVPDAVSRRAAGGGGGACWTGPDVHFGRGPVRQAARAVRQGRPHVRAAAAVGADAGRAGPGVALVPGRRAAASSRTRRCCSPTSPAGGLHRGTIRNRLRHLMELEGRPAADRFSPHALRRACATHNYERGVDLVAIQQLLGHWTVSSTMRYVRPSATFIEDAYRRAVTATLTELTGEDRRMKIRWKLRMAAAQREVWTGAQLRRLLAERAGLELSSASVSALLTKEPSQVKLSTLIALCTALDCTPNDLFEVDTTPSSSPPRRPGAPVEPKAVGRAGPLDAADVSIGNGCSMGKTQRDCVGCGAPVGYLGREYCCRCMRRIREDAAKAPCPDCGKDRVLHADTGRCVLCSRRCTRVRAAGPCAGRDSVPGLPTPGRGRRPPNSRARGAASPGSCALRPVGAARVPGPGRRKDPPRICRVCGELRRHCRARACARRCWQRRPRPARSCAART